MVCVFNAFQFGDRQDEWRARSSDQLRFVGTTECKSNYGDELIRVIQRDMGIASKDLYFRLNVFIT